MNNMPVVKKYQMKMCLYILADAKFWYAVITIVKLGI